MEFWFVPDQVFDGEALRGDHAVAVNGGRVTGLAPVSTIPPTAAIQPVSGTLCPGFIDLQVNGGGGVLFNQSPTLQGIRDILTAHRNLGTVAAMPTVITDAPEILEQAVAAALEAKGTPGFAGLHIEGPHISLARRGTHAARYVRPFEPQTLELVRRLREVEIPTMLTLAPEAASPEHIRAVADTGAIVSLGHTDADFATTAAAIDAGARAATHLFNAMPPLYNRQPGATAAILASNIHAGLICDGHHVHDEMIKLAMRARPRPDLMFLVSDAMPTVGGPDSFDLYGKTIRLSGGRLVNDEGSLAGAHLSQADGVKRMVESLKAPLVAALRMAITIPAQLIARPELAALDGRPLKDLIVLGTDLSLQSPLPERPSIDAAS